MLKAACVLLCLFVTGEGRRVQRSEQSEIGDRALASLLLASGPETAFHAATPASRSFVNGKPTFASPGIARAPVLGMGMPKKGEPGYKRAQVKKFFKSIFGTKGASTKELKQSFLEFEPYYDKSGMPDNLYKPKMPMEAKIISVERIVGPTANGETCNIVIDHGGKLPYIEGQSYGVVPPGISPKNGKPNKVRLYSIASSRYGDDMTGKTTTLCVKRAEYWDPETQTVDPAKKGVCSNYLCDAKCGDVVKLTGPTGKVMLLPEDKPETDIIMAATGTGIAPFRSFLKRMFVEDTPYAKDFKGVAWLFLGVYNTDAILYDDEWKAILKSHPDNFRYDLALSEEMKNKDGGPMFVQHQMEKYSDELYDRLEKGAHMYLCGLKGMVPGIQELLKDVADAKGVDFDDWFKKLKSNGQWHVEVY